MADTDATSLLQQPATGFGLPVEANAPTAAPAFQHLEARQKRRDASSTMDVVQSIWRQDGITDGLVASIVGREMTPDPTFNPFTDPNRKAVEEGIQAEYLPELDKAHSAAHQMYIRDRLLQKQEDLQRLDDLGFWGNVGRIAMGIVNPENLVMGLGAGAVARGVRWGQALGRARSLVGASPVVQAEVNAGASAASAGFARSKTAVGVGIGFGAAENGAYEALRQSINFEDDGSKILEAGLIGAGFTAPFAWAGARSMSRVAKVAEREHAVFKALRDADEGIQLTPEQGKLIREVHANTEAVAKLESGDMSLEEFHAASKAFEGPIEPTGAWMERHGGTVRNQAQDLIDGLPEQPAVWRKRPGVPETPMREAPEKAEPTPVDHEAPHPAESLESLLDRKTDLETSARSDETHLAEALGLRNQEFEVSQAVAESHLHQEAPAEAPSEASTALPDQVEATPAQATIETSQKAIQTAESFIGHDVTWMDRRTGDMMAGRVERVADFGKLLIKDEDGVLRSVAHTELTEFAGEVPHGFIASGSVGAAQVQLVGAITRNSTAAQRIYIPGSDGKWSVPARFDLYNYLNGSANEAVRTIADRLIKDPVANKVHGAQDFTASEWRSHQVRVINGEFHRVAKEAFTEAKKAAQVPMWKSRQFSTDFYEAAAIYTRVPDDSSLVRIPNAAWPQVKEASAAMRKALDAHLAEAQKAGVTGAKNIPSSDTYVNRVWRSDKIREAMELHGEQNVYALLANAMTGMNSRGPLTGDVAKAKRFLGTVMSLEFSPAMQNVHLAGRDMATLREELRAMKMTDSQINTIVDTMFEVKETAGTDAGQASNLRFRFDLDESLALQTTAGRLSVTDLLENDARLLVDTYGRTLAGHTGLAKHGITSQADWAQKLKTITDEAATNPLAGGPRLAREVQWLEDIHSNILGRPMSMADNSFPARSAAAFRGYTRALVLGQLGISAAFEMKQAAAIMGIRSLMTQLPSFGAFLGALRKGHLPDAGLARDVMHITGWGQEKAAAYARAREIDEGFAAEMLTWAEKGANEASHAVNIMSGNASFTSLTRQISGMMAAQRLHDHASGIKTMTPAHEARMSGQGLEGQWLQDTMRDLKTYSVADAGVLKQIRHEDWKANEPETYEKFQLYMSRQVRDAIQDQDLGETLPFMHSTLGKMFGELKTFFLVAHAKNMVKNLHYMDGTTLQVFLIGALGEALAYATQQAINNPHKLEEKLTADSIGRAVFFRMASLGFLPIMTDMAYGAVTGGETLVKPGTTANTDSRSFLKTPSMATAGKLMRLPQTVGGAVLGTGMTTQGTARDAVTLMPGANLYGARAAVDWFSNSFPKSDPTMNSR